MHIFDGSVWVKVLMLWGVAAVARRRWRMQETGGEWRWPAVIGGGGLAERAAKVCC